MSAAMFRETVTNADGSSSEGTCSEAHAQTLRRIAERRGYRTEATPGGGVIITRDIAGRSGTPGHHTVRLEPATPARAPVAYVLTEPEYRPAAREAERFVSGYLAVWAADRDAALRAEAEWGCDADWCTAYRWDGHHVPTCTLARKAAVRAGLRDELAEAGYCDPIPQD